MKLIIAVAFLFIIVLIFFVVWADAKPFKTDDAKLAWEQMQADVAKEKAKDVEGKDKEKVEKLKDKNVKNVLAAKHGKTFKVESYGKGWELKKVRYERDGWVAEETRGNPLVIGGKIIYQSRRVKIWRVE